MRPLWRCVTTGFGSRGWSGLLDGGGRSLPRTGRQVRLGPYRSETSGALRALLTLGCRVQWRSPCSDTLGIGMLIWLPSVSRGWLFPPFKGEPVLVAVKHRSLDRDCGPAGLEAAGAARRTERSARVRSHVAGPGSDFSEV